MGAGASATLQSTVNEEANLPLDACDIVDLDQAKDEISRLRQICHYYRYEAWRF